MPVWARRGLCRNQPLIAAGPSEYEPNAPVPAPEPVGGGRMPVHRARCNAVMASELKASLLHWKFPTCWDLLVYLDLTESPGRSEKCCRTWRHGHLRPGLLGLDLVRKGPV